MAQSCIRCNRRLLISVRLKPGLSDAQRERYEQYMREVPCRACKGARLKPESLAAGTLYLAPPDRHETY